MGFISWLEVVTWSEAWLDWKGIRGFFFDMHTSEMLLLVETGETTFDFNCVGTSSRSNILEVFSSSCLLLSGGDGTEWSNLGLDTQEGENLLGISLTTSCSHSSAILAAVLSSPAVRSNIAFSSSKTTISIAEFDFGGTSAESGRVEFTSDFLSLNSVGSDLEDYVKRVNYQEFFIRLSPRLPHLQKKPSDSNHDEHWVIKTELPNQILVINLL